MKTLIRMRTFKLALVILISFFAHVTVNAAATPGLIHGTVEPYTRSSSGKYTKVGSEVDQGQRIYFRFEVTSKKGEVGPISVDYDVEISVGGKVVKDAQGHAVVSTGDKVVVTAGPFVIPVEKDKNGKALAGKIECHFHGPMGNPWDRVIAHKG